ncbi:hypothetical protein R1flu_012243 [Riccia fluitans]|uniref:Receptor-like serine/threonine-protein kinase n=1 Tax=Riccia fluitans TaxID=41844 RepID=A0ABD1ZAE1_9MARC
MTTEWSSTRLIPRVLVLLPLLLSSVFLLLVFPGVLGNVYYDHVEANFSTSNIKSVDVNGIFLHSINNTFGLGLSTFGFSTGNYYLSIIHLKPQQQVIVWTANRNQPVQRSDLIIFDSSGNLTLQNSLGVGIWSTNTTGGSWLQLQETGNLVVLDKENQTLWQSFDHPSDTLLSGQDFFPGMKLIANKGSSDLSEGSYSMSMQGKDLRLLVEFHPIPQAYWSMAKDAATVVLDTSGSVAYAEIQDSLKSLSLCSKDGSVLSSIPVDNYEDPTLRRATIGHDGTLEILYYSGSTWNSAFSAVKDKCDLPESCGPYGFCSNNGQCSCPPGTDPVNTSDFSKGCIPRLSATRCAAADSHTTVNSSSVSLKLVGNASYYANGFTQARNNTSDLDSCFKACSNDCLCTAFFFQNDTRSCFTWENLGTMKVENNAKHVAYLKVNVGEVTPRGSAPGSSNSSTTIIIIIVIVGITVFLMVGLLVGAWWYHRRRVARAAELAALAAEDEELMEIPGLPTRFTYKELEDATKDFSKKLGAGGFGSVYEGTLADERRIAVKRLESVGQGKKEFWAEVAIIGSIHHVHLVRLLGFCAEGTKRLLVYEFMANGSLDKILFRKDGEAKGDGLVLDWETRMSICLGTAQGLAYLHEDCRERIIHCDIKPENILLDEKFRPKVSDFGLAKLMNPEQNEVFTNLRGTRGYLAPEWLMNYAISDKSDVYSFGMVILELISGRKNFDPNETSEKWYVPIYAYRLMQSRKPSLLADPRLEGFVNEEQLGLLMRIALWCIQDEVTLRPTMKTVVKMIEGMVEVRNPPSSPTMAVRLHGKRYDTSSSKDSLFHSGEMSAVPLSAPR